MRAISRSSSVSQQALQQQQQPSLLQQWGSRIAPVASLVLCGLRAGTSTSAEGALAAKVHLSSVLLVNLQLLDLCRKGSTMPSAAGVYLPAGHVVPEGGKRATVGYARSNRHRSSSADPAAAGLPDACSADAGQPVLCLLANYNAFVVSPYTPRLTAAYRSATLSRWKLMGLSRLAAAAAADSSPAATAAAASKGPPGCVPRGRISRKLLMRQRWQSVLELRAFARSLDYAMFLLFHQGKEQRMRGAVPLGSSDSSGLDAAAFEQYQLLYLYSLQQHGATATDEEPKPQQRAGWFGSRRTSMASSGGGHGEAAAGSGPDGPAAFVQFSSPCNWRNTALSNKSVTDRLLIAELRRSGSTASSRRGSTYESQEGIAANGLLSHELQQRQHKRQSTLQASAPPLEAAAGEQWLPVSVGAMRDALPPSPRAAAARVAFSNAAGEGGAHPPHASSSQAAQESAQAVGGMQVLNALSSLRAGSANLLSSAAQQLRLRQHRQAGSRQAAGRRASRLGHRNKEEGGVAATLLNTSPIAQQQRRHSTGLPDILEPDLEPTEQWQQWQQQVSDTRSLEHSVVDFLDRYEGSLMALNFNSLASEEQRAGSHGHRIHQPMYSDSPDVGSPGSPVGTPTASASWMYRSTRLGALQQNQLSITYTQQPAAALQQQQGQSAAAGDPAATATATGEVGCPEDTLTVSLAHVKVALGPHTVSMLLQLMTSVTAIGSSGWAGGGSSRASQPAGDSSTSQRDASRIRPAASAATGEAAAAAVPPSRLHVQLQLAMCHVKMNMERVRLPNSRRESKAELDWLQTKELLSLQLLDVSSSMHKLLGCPDAGAACAAGSSGHSGLELSCSLAHVGLQDLRACVEQRHVLSGATEPLTVSSMLMSALS